MTTNTNKLSSLWFDEFSPSTVKDVIIPARIKEPLLEAINKKVIPNYMFFGIQGSGKTSTAIALCKDMGYTYLIINASEEGGIDTLRTKLRAYASSISTNGKPKVLIMDEMDGSTGAFQDALRGFMNVFNNVRFIFTANHESKIIPALHSRLKMFNFDVTQEERGKLIGDIARRLVFMLKSHNVTYGIEDVKSVVRTYYPDNRRIIMETQGSVSDGVFAWTGGNGITDNTAVQALARALQTNNFTACCEWSASNADASPTVIINGLFAIMDDVVGTTHHAQYILILNNFSTSASVLCNLSVWVLALCAELLKSIRFKVPTS